jgi:putative two-component system response regulator
MPESEIRKEIENGKGTQFDPKFADIMLSMMDDGFTVEQ